MQLPSKSGHVGPLNMVSYFNDVKSWRNLRDIHSSNFRSDGWFGCNFGGQHQGKTTCFFPRPKPFLSHLNHARKQCFLYLHCKKTTTCVQPKRWWYLFQQKMFKKTNSASFQFVWGWFCFGKSSWFLLEDFLLKIGMSDLGISTLQLHLFSKPPKSWDTPPKTTRLLHQTKSPPSKKKREDIFQPPFFGGSRSFSPGGFLWDCRFTSSLGDVKRPPPMIVNGFCNIQGDGNSISCSALPLCKSVKTFWCTCINSILFERGRENVTYIYI